MRCVCVPQVYMAVYPHCREMVLSQGKPDGEIWRTSSDWRRSVWGLHWALLFISTPPSFLLCRFWLCLCSIEERLALSKFISSSPSLSAFILARSLELLLGVCCITWLSFSLSLLTLLTFLSLFTLFCVCVCVCVSSDSPTAILPASPLTSVFNWLALSSKTHKSIVHLHQVTFSSCLQYFCDFSIVYLVALVCVSLINGYFLLSACRQSCPFVHCAGVKFKRLSLSLVSLSARLSPLPFSVYLSAIRLRPFNSMFSMQSLVCFSFVTRKTFTGASLASPASSGTLFQVNWSNS